MDDALSGSVQIFYNEEEAKSSQFDTKYNIFTLPFIFNGAEIDKSIDNRLFSEKQYR